MKTATPLDGGVFRTLAKGGVPLVMVGMLFGSPHDPDAPNFDQMPLARHATPLECVVMPGELLCNTNRGGNKCKHK